MESRTPSFAMRALGCYRDRGSRGRILNAQARNRTAFDIFHRLFKIPLRPSNNAVASILARISDYEKYQFIEKRERRLVIAIDLCDCCRVKVRCVNSRIPDDSPCLHQVFPYQTSFYKS
jgi:hypothetical protein